MKLQGSEMLFCAFSWRYFLKRKIDFGKGQNAKNINGVTKGFFFNFYPTALV